LAEQIWATGSDLPSKTPQPAIDAIFRPELFANQIAGTHEVHPNQVTHWKREAQEGLKALFERQRGRRSLKDDRDADAL